MKVNSMDSTSGATCGYLAAQILLQVMSSTKEASGNFKTILQTLDSKSQHSIQLALRRALQQKSS
jgi:hypothetical protein